MELLIRCKQWGKVCKKPRVVRCFVIDFDKVLKLYRRPTNGFAYVPKVNLEKEKIWIELHKT